jgi:DNA-binding CsgD family transcriptional regulator
LLPEVEPVVEASAVPEALFGLMLAKAGLEYVRDEFAVWLARTEDAISIGRQAADPVRLWLAEQYRSDALVVLDRPAEARAIADQGRAACELGRQAVSLRHWDALRGRQLYFAGSLADATAVLEGAYGSEEHVEVVSVIDAGAVTILGQLALHTGDDQLARACTTTAEAMLETGLPEVRRLATLFLALQWMARGNPAEAHRLVVELGDDRRVSTLPVYPMDVGDPPQLMRIALAVHDDQLAREVLAVAEHRAARNPAVATIVGADAHCRGLLSRSSVELATAVDAFERGPRPLARASALEDLGCMLIDDGGREDGVERLSAALRLYVEMGASWDAMRVRGRLRALGVRRRLVQPARPETGWEALTDSELLVVRQVAQGLTNREVARQLFVSPHTVSMHLRHAFRKLGIRSRVELARLVAVQAD